VLSAVNSARQTASASSRLSERLAVLRRTSTARSIGSNGRASFTTTIPKGATAGQCSVTVIVHTTSLGDTTDRTVITIQR